MINTPSFRLDRASNGGTYPSDPWIHLGTVDKFTTALNILRAVRALALNTGDDELTKYALELQAAVIEWSKILPKPAEEQSPGGKLSDYPPGMGYM